MTAPVFRAAGAKRDGDGFIAVPASAAAGDLLIIFAVASSDPTIASGPNGWGLNISVTNQGLWWTVWTRWANSTDHGTTVDLSNGGKGATFYGGRCLAYSGAGGIDAFLTNTTHTTPSATTTQPNEATIEAWMGMGTAAGNAAVTNRVSDNFGAFIAWFLWEGDTTQAASGTAVGNHASSTTSASMGTSLTLVIYPSTSLLIESGGGWTDQSTGSSITITKPPGLATGDLLVAICGAAGNGANAWSSTPAPSGWSQIAGSNAQSTSTACVMYSKTVTSSEPVNYAFSAPAVSGIDAGQAGVIVAFRNVTAIAAAASKTSSGTSLTTPKISGYGAGLTLVQALFTPTYGTSGSGYNIYLYPCPTKAVTSQMKDVLLGNHCTYDTIGAMPSGGWGGDAFTSPYNVQYAAMSLLLSPVSLGPGESIVMVV